MKKKECPFCLGIKEVFDARSDRMKECKKCDENGQVDYDIEESFHYLD